MDNLESNNDSYYTPVPLTWVGNFPKERHFFGAVHCESYDEWLLFLTLPQSQYDYMEEAYHHWQYCFEMAEMSYKTICVWECEIPYPEDELALSQIQFEGLEIWTGVEEYFDAKFEDILSNDIYN